MFNNKIKSNQEKLAKKLSSLDTTANHSKELYKKTMASISDNEAKSVYQQRLLLKDDDSYSKNHTVLLSRYKNFLPIGVVAIILVAGGVGITNKIGSRSSTQNNIQTVPVNGTVDSTVSSINTDFNQESNLIDQTLVQVEDSASTIGSTATQIGETSNANSF